ncbi:hypothetical protein KY363_04185 [Candidatus Woesearchaeota archaeon]|nr:hypothetical protein [Candidatus Woesearchaeota archaeon]
MLKKQHAIYLLAAIFICAFGVRLFLAFQSPTFEIGEAYFSQRQIESIKESYIPAYSDSLSYSGRTDVFPPLYYYVLSLFSLLFGTVLALKVIPNLFACSLVIIIYLIVMEMTKNRNISLFCAFTAAFIPGFFAGTVNSASIVSFTLPLVFYLIYCFMRIKERVFLNRFLAVAFVLALTSAISFLLVFALLIYLLLAKLEYKVQVRRELEVILFATFLTLWINVIIYKKAFLFHSYALIWQNIPVQILDSYFRQVDIIASVTNIGLLTLLLGVYAIYKYMLKERDKRTYLLMAFALAVAILLWFRLITLEEGLMFLGATLIPLMGQTLAIFFRYLEVTKISEYRVFFWIPLVLLLLLTSVLPSVAKASVSVSESVSIEELKALEWLRLSTPEESVVLSTIDEGSMIAAVAERKDVADSSFLLIRSPSDVYDDISSMYTVRFKTQAVELMDKYGVDYIYFSPRAKAQFGIDELKYVEPDCFELVYNETVLIYRSFCELKA